MTERQPQNKKTSLNYIFEYRKCVQLQNIKISFVQDVQIEIILRQKSFLAILFYSGIHVTYGLFSSSLHPGNVLLN